MRLHREMRIFYFFFFFLLCPAS
uniref:Uncharacterized protein n=1 Tax=Arundo donax TaxID=35708 RepID=A0A0A8XXU6_ARUDO